MLRGALKGSLRLQIPVLNSPLLHCMSTGDSKGSVIRNFLQYWDVLETKPGDDFNYNHNKYELLHNSWDTRMSHFCIIWIKLFLTLPPLPDLARSSVVAIWGSCPFWDYLRQLAGDRKGACLPEKSAGLCGCLHLCVIPTICLGVYQFKARIWSSWLRFCPGLLSQSLASLYIGYL